MLWSGGGSFQKLRSPLPAPLLRPPNVRPLGEKFGGGSGTPSATPRRPPRAASPPPAVSAAPARCPPGAGARGAGPAQVEARGGRARSPLAARPRRACPVGRRWGSERRPGGGGGGGRWGAPHLGSGGRRELRGGREGRSCFLRAAEERSIIITKY